MSTDSRGETARGSTHADLVPLVTRLAGRRILVVADIVADEFVHTDSPRVSREAPVLIVRYRGSRVVPGGGGNAAANIAALGGVPVVVGEVGDDEHGRAVVAHLEAAGADVSALFVRAGFVTPRKSRILAGDKHVAGQQVLRLDRIDPLPHDEPFRRSLRSLLVGLLPGVEGVLVSDYGLGFVEPAWVQELILRSAERARLRVALDSRYRLFEHHGVDVATPSEPEVEVALGRTLADAAAAEAAGMETLGRLGAQALVLTRGSEGLLLLHRDRPTEHVPAFGSGAVTDVTGAGDTVIATLTLALAAGADWLDAARLANAAAGIAVTKMGTATVSGAELAEALGVA